MRNVIPLLRRLPVLPKRSFYQCASKTDAEPPTPSHTVRSEKPIEPLEFSPPSTAEPAQEVSIRDDLAAWLAHPSSLPTSQNLSVISSRWSSFADAALFADHRPLLMRPGGLKKTDVAQSSMADLLAPRPDVPTQHPTFTLKEEENKPAQAAAYLASSLAAWTDPAESTRGSIQCASVLRKRRKKMNKHKYRKLLKRNRIARKND